MAHPEEIEAILQKGAERARALARPLLDRLRHAVGLRRFQPLAASAAPVAKAKTALPVFKQYREADGQFYFKLSAHDGRVLLQSQGFAGGREAGEWVKRLKLEGAAALAGAPVALGEGVQADEVGQALTALQQAEA
jgi:tryptophanyl-tRNA synthetase